MHLYVLGAIGHFYTMQVSLTCTRSAKNATANLSARLHHDIKFWQSLCVEMITHLTYLAKIVHRAAPGIGYTDASGQGPVGF